MFGHSFRRITVVATVLALVGATALMSAAHAQETDNDVVTVSATITSVTPLTITLCDTSANFGTGLDANGSLATSDDVVVALPGDANVGEGAYYQWTPTCATGSFVTVMSGNAWDGAICATVNPNDSSLDQGDLRYSPTSLVDFFQPYNQVVPNSFPFPACDAPSDWLDAINGSGATGTPGTHPYTFYYFLRIDRTDTSGTFSATTTWSVSS